jgi:3-oxoacyl-(acyl-carrier-protein) synthase
MMIMSKNKRIVITGIGPLCAIGFGKQDVWQAVMNGETGLTKDEFLIDGEKLDAFFYHKINRFSIDDFGIDKKILNDIRTWKKQDNPLDLFYVLAVVKLALDDAKIEYRDADNTKGLGLVLTHENPGLDQFYEGVINQSYDLLRADNKKSKKEYLIEFYNRFDKEAYDLQTFMFLFHVARVFNIHNYSVFLSNACASGLFALETAADIIRTGKCDRVVVGGADHTSIFKCIWFKNIDMYAKDGKIKPFDKNRNGFVPGDGGAGIVMEDFDSARKRKAHIYAEYLGGGFHLEGWKVAIPAISGDSYKISVEAAIKNSKIKKSDIDLIIPHGVGTKVTDAYEAKVITDIFGRNPKRPLITAFKPYVGHNLGSTALIETAILLMALEKNMVPRTLNYNEVDYNLGIRLVKKNIKAKLKTALKMACGFAGYNGAAIFRKIR